jgi:hypothetical protein
MKMSKEEKEAIETFKNIVIQEYDWWINKDDYAESNVEEANDAIKTILKLIEKQQKEIEELKEDNNHQWEERCKLTFKLQNSISKDKIREKINEHKNNIPYLSKFDDWKEKEYTNEDITNYCIETLEELLKE